MVMAVDSPPWSPFSRARGRRQPIDGGRYHAFLESTVLEAAWTGGTSGMYISKVLGLARQKQGGDEAVTLGWITAKVYKTYRLRSLWVIAIATAAIALGLTPETSVLAQPTAVRSAGGALPTRWHRIGPTVDGSPVGDAAPLAGRVSAFAVLGGRVSVEVIGTLAGIWRKTGTGSWHDETSASWPSTAIGSLAVDPLKPSVLYAGTGYDDVDDSGVQAGEGILKSTDGGRSWAPLAASQSLIRGYGVTGLAVDPRNDRVVVAAANNGLFRSANAGRSWTEVKPISPGPYGVAEVRLAVDPVSGVMLAGVAQSYGIKARLASRVLSTGHAIYRSTNGGRTWSAYAVDSESGGGQVVVPAIGTIKGGPTYAYALDSTGGVRSGVYTSANGGQSWQLRTVQDVTTKASIGQMVVDPLNAKRAYFAQSDGPFEYTWGSSSVATIVSSDGSFPEFGDWRALAIGPAPNSAWGLYGGTDGGPCMYSFRTRRFYNQSAGLTSGIDYFGSAESANREVSGAQDLGVDVYGGSKVREVYHADAFGVLIDRNKPSTYYAGIYGAYGETEFVVSHDSGATWNPVALPAPQPTAPFYMRLEQASDDPNLLILPEQNGTLYISTDDGKHWVARTIGGLAGDYPDRSARRSNTQRQESGHLCRNGIRISLAQHDSGRDLDASAENFSAVGEGHCDRPCRLPHYR